MLFTQISTKGKTIYLKPEKKLNKAIKIFKECVADGWVDRYENELTSLSLKISLRNAIQNFFSHKKNNVIPIRCQR
jgi:hypothetical protein